MTGGHGVRATYIDGCRCNSCSAANRTYQLEQRAKRLAWGLPKLDDRHGTLNGYNNWGCRCLPCAVTKSVANAEARRVAS